MFLSLHHTVRFIMQSHFSKEVIIIPNEHDQCSSETPVNSIETKTCTKCGNDKLLKDFRFRKDKGYYIAKCKLCLNNSNKEYNKNNRDKERLRGQRSYTKHRVSRLESKQTPKVKLARKGYYSKKSEEINSSLKKWRDENPIVVKTKRKEHRAKFSEKIKQYKKADFQKSKEKLTDAYVVNRIHSVTKTDKDIIRQHPDIIEEYRYKLKIVRSLKEFNKTINQKQQPCYQ